MYKKVTNVLDLLTVQPIVLQCVLMDNNEIYFNGRRFGKVKDEEILKYAMVQYSVEEQ